MAWIAAHRARQSGGSNGERVSEDPARFPGRTSRWRTSVARASSHPSGAEPGLGARRHRSGEAEVRRARHLGHGDRPRRPRPPGRQRVRLGVVERHRDRLDLRWPRHLPQVQGAAVVDGCRVTRHDERTFSPAQLGEGWRLACLVQATRDLEIEVPPLTTRPKAATVGVGRQVILRPAVQKRYVELEEPTLSDQRPDLVRLLDAIDDLEPVPDLYALRRLPTVLRQAGFKVTAVVVDEALIDVEPGDTTTTRYAIAFDLGTTTVVATLLDLETGTPVAVSSSLNKQQPFGADVISRISATMLDPEHSTACGRPPHDDARRADRRGLQGGRRRPGPRVRGRARRQRHDDRARSRHRPGAARRRAVRDDHGAAADVLASDLGLALHPRARAVVFPALGAYVGGDIVAGMLATGMDRDKRPGCSSTSAPTARSCSATATGSCRPRRRRVRRSRAARSGAACARPTARSRWSVCPATSTVALAGHRRRRAPRAVRLRPGRRRGRAGAARAARQLRTVRHRRDAAEIAPALADRLTRIGQERVFVLHRPAEEPAGGVGGALAARRARAPVRQGRDLDRLVAARRPSWGSSRRRPAGAAGGLVRQLPLARVRGPDRAGAEAARATDRLRGQRGRRGSEDGPAVHPRARGCGDAAERRWTYVELSDRSDFNDRFVEQLAFGS